MTLFESFGQPSSGTRVIGTAIFADSGLRDYPSALAAAEAFVQWHKDAEDARKPRVDSHSVSYEDDCGERITVTFKQLATALRAVGVAKLCGRSLFDAQSTALALEAL